MNKKSLALMVLSAAALTCQPVLAESTHGYRYIGGSIGFMNFENKGSPDASINSLEARIGGYANDYLALEGRLGIGLTDDTITVTGTDVDLSLRYSLGAYLRAGYPVSEQVFPYVILGFSRADFEVETSLGSENEAETDSSYGLGVDVEIANMALTAEYLNMIDKNDTTFSGFTIGFTTKF